MKVARLRKAARLSSPKSYGASANSDACINYRSLSLAKPVSAEQTYGFRIRLSDWGQDCRRAWSQIRLPGTAQPQ